MKPTFKEFLSEAPINDYKTFGNWDKGSSFRSKRDRMLIQHPTSIQRVKNKFNNTNVDFNLYFVNSKEANRYTEVGRVKLDWVRDNLGNEVADEVAKNHKDTITVIFTNNKGDQRVAMSAWIMAHRIMHALARTGGVGDFHYYKETSNHLISQLANIMDCYGIRNFPDSERKLTDGGYSEATAKQSRQKQLQMLNLFYELGTFKSARDRNIRDWFEILNELGAQYMTTGRIKFNPPPETFGNKAWGNSGMRHRLLPDAKDDANELVSMLARDMEYQIDALLGSSINDILVM